MEDKLISCRQAVQQGIERLRKPNWSHPFDHIKIDIIDGELGPWIHLFSPLNNMINGNDPTSILWFNEDAFANVDAEALIPYNGPPPDSEEYQAQVYRPSYGQAD